MMIQDFLGKEWEIDCMGCAIAQGRMTPPGGWIKKTDHFRLHQDPLIPLPGFLVIASTRHIRSIADMTGEEYSEFSRLVREAVTAIKQAAVAEHLTIIQEESSQHFHLWFFPWTASVIEKHGKPSLTIIRGIMAEYQNQRFQPEAWEQLKQTIEFIKANLPA